jgi:hypothetical protein
MVSLIHRDYRESLHRPPNITWGALGSGALAQVSVCAQRGAASSDLPVCFGSQRRTPRDSGSVVASPGRLMKHSGAVVRTGERCRAAGPRLDLPTPQETPCSRIS